MSELTNIPLKTIDGGEQRLADYAGKVVLVVNVASKCGLTPQYEGLEKLYAAYRDQGLVVLGFPANDFMGQEPGTDAEIADFCKLTYDVDFPMFSKIMVAGPDKHALYAALVEARPFSDTSKDAMREKFKGYGMTPSADPEVLWNFEKFLIGRDGSVVARFAPDTTPDDPALVEAVQRELAKPE